MSIQRYPCDCCRHMTFAETFADERPSRYDICPVCFWEQDSIGLDDPSAANHGLTLRQGQANYAKFGACEKTMVLHVRKPTQEEIDALPFGGW